MKNPSLRERLAPTKNNRLIHTSEASTHAETRSGKLTRINDTEKLARFRAGVPLLKDIDYSPLEERFTSWEHIQIAAIDMFDQSITQSQALQESPVAAVRHASIAGVGTIGAFLRVIPEVNHGTHSNEHLANSSIRTILWWAALSEEAESDLSMLVCNPKPNLRLHPREYNVGLQFDPRFFTVTDDQPSVPSVDLDTHYIESLGKETVKSINFGVKGTEIYYGCPFRVDLPKLYSAFTKAAIRSDLL